MKRFLVGQFINGFIGPYEIIESESAREAVRSYNSRMSKSSGEVMCLIDKKSGKPIHHHPSVETSECMRILTSYKKRDHNQ